jgi:hypothetical protein
MKKDNKTICSYCGKRFNFDTMKYGLCSDCYEMIIRLGYESSFLERDSLKQFLSKAIDQTREETIKEILSELRLKLRNTYKAEDIADTAFLTESDLESVLNK